MKNSVRKIFYLLLVMFPFTGVAQFSNSDQQQMQNITNLSVSDFILNTPIPYSVNNANSYYFPYIFYQEEYSCAQASSLVYLFTYELAVRRNRYVLFDDPYNKYHIPSHFAWNFFNETNSFKGVSFMDTWHLIKTAGSPFTPDWGTTYFGGSSKWMSGYSKYYEGMKNRISEMKAIPTDTEVGINTLKHWLANHCSDENMGGCANIFVSSNSPSGILQTGTEEAGKHIYTYFSTPTHSITIVGYNDSIRYDFNNDGQYTNGIDITGDGVVNVKDWEIGAVLIVNSHGPEFGDNGSAYLPYRLLATTSAGGGVWNACTYVVEVRDEVFPQITYKATVKHNRRNMIKISAGISSDTSATNPETIIDFGVFNYQGGPYYMQGAAYDGYQSLELGLDVTPLLNSMSPDQLYKFFFIIDENDPSGLGIGEITRFALMDYTSGIGTEFVASQTNVNLTNNNRTMVSVVRSIHFTKPEISTGIINTIINTPFQVPLIATQGKPPYRWDFNHDYSMEEFSGSFPTINGTNLVLSSSDNGYGTINLPFNFPFFDKEYNQLVINADGFFTFRYEELNWPYLCSKENQNRATKMIAPFLADLVLSSVKYEMDTNIVTLFISGKVKNEIDNGIRFVVKLYKSGVIEFYYGDMIYLSNSFESVISRGDDAHYFRTEISGAAAPLCSNRNFRFTPPPRINGLYISRTGIVSGNFQNSVYNGLFSVTCYDNNDVKCNKNIYFNCTPVSISENLTSIMNQATPNPSSGVFKIADPNNSYLIKEIFIYNLAGKEIRSFSINQNSTEINLTDLPAGVYIAKILLETDLEQKIKLIIKH
jgi:hypothetical protein